MKYFLQAMRKYQRQAHDIPPSLLWMNKCCEIQASVFYRHKQ
ncbi:Hypothetical protein SmN45_2575 [Serratia marcescens]|nr:Hypothetical protein SmN45_2575 [Serratia marcescens]